MVVKHGEEEMVALYNLVAGAGANDGAKLMARIIAAFKGKTLDNIEIGSGGAVRVTEVGEDAPITVGEFKEDEFKSILDETRKRRSRCKGLRLTKHLASGKQSLISSVYLQRFNRLNCCTSCLLRCFAVKVQYTEDNVLQHL